MVNRQTYIVGAIGILVGLVIGANSSQNAQTVSFAGNNPNNPDIQNMQSVHTSPGYLRQRSTERGLSSTFLNSPFRLTAPRQTSPEENAARLQAIRDSKNIDNTDTMYGAPTDGMTLRGAPVIVRQRVPECAQYTGPRYTSCLEAYINGDNWVPNYYPIDYSN